MHEEAETEYNKLDVIDRKVLRWMTLNVPSSVPSWIEYTVRSYQNLKGININGQVLLTEIADVDFSEANLNSAKMTIPA